MEKETGLSGINSPSLRGERGSGPWDSLGKSTGVGCHFLLQCMKVKSESEVAQLSPALSDPMDCSLPGSSVHGIFQARGLEWGALYVFQKAPERNLFVHLFVKFLFQY